VQPKEKRLLDREGFTTVQHKLRGNTKFAFDDLFNIEEDENKSAG
jgi:hypothetical protein